MTTKTPRKPRQNALPQIPGGVGIAPLYRGKARSEEQNRIAVLVSENGSILALAKKLNLSQAYLSQIVSGKRRASNRYRCALGLKPKTALAPVCPKHGVVHNGKCPAVRHSSNTPLSMTTGSPLTPRNWRRR